MHFFIYINQKHFYSIKHDWTSRRMVFVINWFEENWNYSTRKKKYLIFMMINLLLEKVIPSQCPWLPANSFNGLQSSETHLTVLVSFVNNGTFWMIEKNFIRYFSNFNVAKQFLLLKFRCDKIVTCKNWRFTTRFKRMQHFAPPNFRLRIEGRLCEKKGKGWRQVHQKKSLHQPIIWKHQFGN